MVVALPVGALALRDVRMLASTWDRIIATDADYDGVLPFGGFNVNPDYDHAEYAEALACSEPGDIRSISVEILDSRSGS